MAVRDFVATIPTTNARITVTLGVFIATAAKYLLSSTGWTPDRDWLLFIGGMTGLDTAHFFAKRKTEFEPPPSDPESDHAD